MPEGAAIWELQIPRNEGLVATTPLVTLVFTSCRAPPAWIVIGPTTWPSVTKIGTTHPPSGGQFSPGRSSVRPGRRPGPKLGTGRHGAGGAPRTLRWFGRW